MGGVGAKKSPWPWALGASSKLGGGRALYFVDSRAELFGREPLPSHPREDRTVEKSIRAGYAGWIVKRVCAPLFDFPIQDAFATLAGVGFEFV